MSQHAKDQWEKRVGGKPPADVACLLSECVIIQQHRDVYSSRGVPMRMLAIYFHPERNIFFKVDQKRFQVVTVITKKALVCESEGCNGSGRCDIVR